MSVAQNSFTAAISRSRSSGRDRRWSPSLISVSTTSSLEKCETRSSAWRQGTSGSCTPLQDVHRAAVVDQPAEHEMLAALLDQLLGDRIGLAVVIVRRPKSRRPSPRSRVDGVGELLPEQFLGEIDRRRDQHHAGDRRRVLAPSRSARASSSASQPPMEEPITTCGPLAKLRVDGKALGQPAADGAVEEVAAQLAVAGIIETDAGAALRLGPVVERLRLGALHVGLEAAQPEQPRPAGRTLALAHAHGDGSLRRR